MSNDKTDENQNLFPAWKVFVFVLAAQMLPKLLHLWLSERLSWGIGWFMAFALFYVTPPRLGTRPNLLKALFWSAAAGFAAFTSESQVSLSSPPHSPTSAARRSPSPLRGRR